MYRDRISKSVKILGIIVDDVLSCSSHITQRKKEMKIKHWVLFLGTSFVYNLM